MNKTVLVLLPGLDGTGVLFRPLLPHLPSTIPTIIVDYPPDVPKGYSQLLPLVMEALPKDQPFVILAESFSGPLAIMAASTRPRGLIGLVLCASFVRNPFWLRPRWLAFLVHPFLIRCLRSLSHNKLLLGRHSTAALQTLLADCVARVQPPVLACRARAVLGVDVRAQLKLCRVPLLYLLAEQDRVVPRQNLRDILAEVPETQIAPIAAPHLLLQTQPAAAAMAIAGFIETLPRAD